MSNFDCTSPGGTFDSRDLIERLEELRAAYAAHALNNALALAVMKLYGTH